jgi:hypothetical protein
VGKINNFNSGSRSGEERKYQRVDIIVFTLLLLCLTLLQGWFFYQQTTGNPDYYHSDMKAYIQTMLGQDTKYSFPYPIFFWFCAFWNLFMSPEAAVAVGTALLNAGSMIVLKIAFQRMAGSNLRNQMGRFGIIAGPILSILSLSLFYVSMLLPPPGRWIPGMKHVYLGIFSGNPFHNATYLATRPFAILAFFWFIQLLPCYEKGWNRQKINMSYADSNTDRNGGSGVTIRDYWLFATFLLLTTMTKPSFTLVFVGTAGVIMGYRLIRSKFQNLVPTLQLTLCFLPTFADLIYQYRGVFVGEAGAESGVGFGLGEVWKLYCDNIPIAIFVAAAFPILVLICNVQEWKKDNVFRFSWQLYLMSLIMLYLLYEKGFRKPDFNFSWGYMHGLFFLFLGSLWLLVRQTISSLVAPIRPGKRFLLALQWLAYAAHLISGIMYFLPILQGEMYY